MSRSIRFLSRSSTMCANCSTIVDLRSLYNVNIGTKVRFRHTGETGVVVSFLSDGMLGVKPDHDPAWVIPTYPEDLVPATEPVKSFVPPPPTQAPPPLRDLKQSVAVDQPLGIQLIFEPKPGSDGSVTRYNTWLLNDTRYEYLYELGLYIGDDCLLRREGKIGSTSIHEVGDVLADELNDRPEAEVALRRITTAGTDPEQFKIIKITPKAFVKQVDLIPVINTLAHRFVVLPTDETAPAAPQDDLKQYTRQLVKEKKPVVPKPNIVKYEAYDSEAFANFMNEIDLHIESLVANPARLDRSEIIRVQLKHFDKFMQRAIRLGIPKVFIIHGVGEGKLRDAVADKLRAMYEVRQFKNEYHHKYGYGATEVWLD
jgi:Smr domain